MRYLLTALLLLPVLVSAQELHTFRNGEVADADKLNESLQYILNNASGGCSVEQVDNTAEITCADGTTAVVPGYGTVVVYPEGTIGEAPPSTLPTGEVVWVDATGVVLAKVYRSGVMNYVNFGLNHLGYEVVGHLINLDGSEEVAVSAFSYGGSFYFIDNDCGGTPYGWTTSFTESLLDLDGRLYTQSARLTDGTLMRGLRKSGAYNENTGVYTPTSDCMEIERVVSTYSLSEFTPAPEILNAAYPVRLEQLP